MSEKTDMKTIHMAGPWITELEIQTVEKAMRDWYDEPYKYCEAFQDEFAAWHGRKHALMTPNCTSAIHLLLTALGVGPGDEVIVPECTWIATGAGITHLGATPVFCDIDQSNWCMSPAALETAITDRTKAAIVVDVFGNMAQWDELNAIAEKYGIKLIEDSAEALGSVYKGNRAGTFGVGSVFSFHRTKTLTTGEGGMLLLDDGELFDFCSMWRDHGRKAGGAVYYNYEVTYKYMPFNVQAAIGYAQFQRIDEIVERKHWMLEKYREHLDGVPDIQLNAEPEYVYNGAWITGLVFGKSHNLDKHTIMDKLRDLGVPSRPFFYPLSSLPAYRGMQEKHESTNPIAYDICDRGINLPCAFTVDEEQIQFVCNGIKKLVGC